MLRATQDTPTLRAAFVYGIVTLSDLTFQTVPLTAFLATSESYNPMKAGTSMVWAVPRSIATTWGITFVFSSSRY